MKNISIFLLFLAISNTAFTQEKIAVIDYEKVISNSPQKFEFDYVSAEIDSFVNKLGRKQIAVHQRNYEEMIKRYQNSCTNFESMRKIEEVLRNQEKKLVALEKFATDTLSFLRQKLNYEVQKIVEKEIEEYKKYSEFEFVGDANKSYFHITKIQDISYQISFQLRQKYNLPLRKLARQKVIFNIKDIYNLNQDLQKRFDYAILK